VRKARDGLHRCALTAPIPAAIPARAPVCNAGRATDTGSKRPGC